MKVLGGVGCPLPGWFSSSGFGVSALTGQSFPGVLFGPSAQIALGLGGQTFSFEFGLGYEGVYSWNYSGRLGSGANSSYVQAMAFSAVLGPAAWFGRFYFHPFVSMRYQVEYMDPYLGMLDIIGTYPNFGAELGVNILEKYNIMFIARAELNSFFGGIAFRPLEF